LLCRASPPRRPSSPLLRSRRPPQSLLSAEVHTDHHTSSPRHEEIGGERHSRLGQSSSFRGGRLRGTGKCRGSFVYPPLSSTTGNLLAPVTPIALTVGWSCYGR
jgi:hypothetical protein